MSFEDGLNLFLLWLALFALVCLFETGDSQTDHDFDSIWAFLSFVARFYVLYAALALLWGAILIYAPGFALIILIVVAFRLDRWLGQRKAVQHLNLLLQPTRLVEYGVVGMSIAFFLRLAFSYQVSPMVFWGLVVGVLVWLMRIASLVESISLKMAEMLSSERVFMGINNLLAWACFGVGMFIFGFSVAPDVFVSTLEEFFDFIHPQYSLWFGVMCLMLSGIFEPIFTCSQTWLTRLGKSLVWGLAAGMLLLITSAFFRPETRNPETHITIVLIAISVCVLFGVLRWGEDYRDWRRTRTVLPHTEAETSETHLSIRNSFHFMLMVFIILFFILNGCGLLSWQYQSMDDYGYYDW